MIDHFVEQSRHAWTGEGIITSTRVRLFPIQLEQLSHPKFLSLLKCHVMNEWRLTFKCSPLQPDNASSSGSAVHLNYPILKSITLKCVCVCVPPFLLFTLGHYFGQVLIVPPTPVLLAGLIHARTLQALREANLASQGLNVIHGGREGLAVPQGSLDSHSCCKSWDFDKSFPPVLSLSTSHHRFVLSQTNFEIPLTAIRFGSQQCALYQRPLFFASLAVRTFPLCFRLA